MAKFEDHFLNEIRGRVPISQVIGPHVAFDRKKTRASKGDYWFCCPVHGEKSPSAHCEDKKGRWRCFGCGAGGDHFQFMVDVQGVTFPRAVEIVAGLAGVPLPGSKPLTDEEKREWARRKAKQEAEQAKRESDAAADRERRVDTVKGIWQDTMPFRNTAAQAYLNWRCPGLGDFDDENIRYHPGLAHPTVAGLHPCLVARVVNVAGKGVAIWRIYLEKHGHGKLQGCDAKLGLGPSAGGAVRLGGTAEHIAICEGVETARAIKLLGVREPVWPALSTSGIMGFVTPAGIKRITCYPDPDGDKWKTRYRQDGSRYISEPPGMVAVQKFKEANPEVDIRIADAAFSSDYLEVLQRTKGVPVR